MPEGGASGRHPPRATSSRTSTRSRPARARSSRSPAARSACSTSTASSTRCATAARTRAGRSARAFDSSLRSRRVRAQYDAPPGRELVRCPWHGWEFDLRTGQSWFDPERTRVRSYRVSVENAGEPVPGPYVAERYGVTVEDSYVVVDLEGDPGPALRSRRRGRARGARSRRPTARTPPTASAAPPAARASESTRRSTSGNSSVPHHEQRRRAKRARLAAGRLARLERRDQARGERLAGRCPRRRGSSRARRRSPTSMLPTARQPGPASTAQVAVTPSPEKAAASPEASITASWRHQR